MSVAEDGTARPHSIQGARTHRTVSMDSSLRSILVVDDEADIRNIIKMSLELSGGFAVHVAEGSDPALAVLEQTKPDLILLDVMMPGRDGPETLREIRTRFPDADLPVIFLTAKVQPHEITQYRNLGAIDVLAKPFDPLGLAADIRSIWEHYHA